MNNYIEKAIPVTEQKWDENTIPLVSISCITYNHENFIRDAIEGFLMQRTTFPVEILIHDDAIIGTNVAMMAFTLIGAHCKIGSHCFFGAKSTVGGGCKIDEQTFVGINATIFDDRIVGRKCIVGACTVLKRDLSDFSSCKTNIDSMIVKTYDENIVEKKLLFSENKH
jgi:acyl-[acyl carrier protein]--UDP-N-acetylglucosamine O-acyltransferase